VKCISVHEAYVLIKVSRDAFVRGVVSELKKLPHVERAEILFGDYDIIVKIKAEKLYDIENLVVDKISSIEGIRETMTMFCVDEKVLSGWVLWRSVMCS